jgi:hypothetical protein
MGKIELELAKPKNKPARGAITHIPKNIPKNPNKKYPPIRSCHFTPGCNLFMLYNYNNNLFKRICKNFVNGRLALPSFSKRRNSFDVMY